MKRWFDKHKAGNKEFEVGDLVLKWDHPHDENGKHTNFQQLLVGPFQITAKLGPSPYKLQDLQGWEENLPVNGLVLKPISFDFYFSVILYINKLVCFIFDLFYFVCF